MLRREAQSGRVTRFPSLPFLQPQPHGDLSSSSSHLSPAPRYRRHPSSLGPLPGGRCTPATLSAPAPPTHAHTVFQGRDPPPGRSCITNSLYIQADCLIQVSISHPFSPPLPVQRRLQWELLIWGGFCRWFFFFPPESSEDHLCPGSASLLRTLPRVPVEMGCRNDEKPPRRLLTCSQLLCIEGELV